MTTSIPEIYNARQRAFLNALSVTGNVTVACRTVGIERSTAYRWKESDPEFAIAYEDALAQAADLIEDEAHRRAVRGIDEPVVYQGQLTMLYERDELGQIVFEEMRTIVPDEDGNPTVQIKRMPRLLLDENGQPRCLTVRKYSDQLLSRLLDAHKPDKYQRNVKMDLNAKVQLNQMSDDEIRAELAALAAAGIVPGEPDDCSDLV